MIYPPNPHPQVFPKLIALWNQSPREFYAYLRRFWIDGNDADTYLYLAQKWVVSEVDKEYFDSTPSLEKKHGG